MLSALRPLAFLALPLSVLAAEEVRYNRDIRPILSENCFSCHGPDEKARKAKLRLDLPADALKEHKTGIPIVPGDLKKSEAWARITSGDEDDVMPPPKSHLKLSAEDKAKVKAWLEQGAKYEDHWAFLPPRRPALPADLKGSPIDAFVDQGLHRTGLKANPEAERATLLRRLSLDLTGLAPSAEELETFCRTAPAAPMRSRWTACWPRRTSANAWRSIGWMPPATPTPTGSRSTAVASSGFGATG